MAVKHRVLIAALVCALLASCATTHTVYACSVCGEGYYGYEDAYACHHAEVYVIHQ